MLLDIKEENVTSLEISYLYDDQMLMPGQKSGLKTKDEFGLTQRMRYHKTGLN